MAVKPDQTSNREALNSWLAAGSIAIAVVSAILSCVAITSANKSSRLAMMISLRLELNKATDDLVSVILSDSIQAESLDFAIYRWDSTFVLARDAATSGAMDPEHWEATLDPLCKLGKRVDFLVMSDSSARLDSLRSVCENAEKTSND